MAISFAPFRFVDAGAEFNTRAIGLRHHMATN